MDEIPVEVIRKTTRDILLKNRQVLREQESDVHRHIDESSILPNNRIDAIVNKLKTKISISASELCNLKNSLMDESNYIELVLNTHGALRGLVRELSGHDAEKQTIAAGCLCNLALGDSQASLAISKSAGPYLVVALDNLSMELAVTCAWTLGNLAGAGHKVCELLITQGTLNKMISLLNCSNDEIKEAGEYAIMHFVYQMKDELSNRHLSEIIEECLKSDLTKSSAQIIFILSCHKAFMECISVACFLKKVLNELTLCVKYHDRNCKKTDFCCKLVYIIRVLGNLQLDDDIYNYIMTFFLNNDLEKDFIQIMSSDSEYLINSLLWFLGNLYKFGNHNVFFNKLIQSF